MKALLPLILLALPAVAQAEGRLVSLGGSVTEIVAALGAGDRLVARDSTSSWPPTVTALPDVGYIRALSPEGVLAVAPDLIISETGAGPVEAVEVLRAAGIPFIEMPDDPTPEGVLAKIDAVAAALDLPTEGRALHEATARALDEARARAAAVQTPVRVLFVLALQNGRVMVGGEGTSAEGIIALAGGVNAAKGFGGYKPMTDEALLAAAPDAILVMDRGGALAITPESLAAHAALGQTPAVQSGRIIAMDGLKLLGFGPRTPEAARELHDALHGG